MFISASCSTARGPLFMQELVSSDADPNLYIYRSSSAIMIGAKWEFAIDRDVVVNLSNGTYAKLPIKPGKHEIIAANAEDVAQPPLIIEFEATKGKNTYIKYEMKSKRGFLMDLIDRPILKNLFIEVEEGQALAELKELRLTTLPQRKFITTSRTDDLNQDFVKDFKDNSNYFYKFDPRYSVDYMVSIVRMNVFSSPTTRNTGEILLSFGLIGEEKFFDCNVFFSKLSAEEKKLVDSRMEDHHFICRDPVYTSESALASFPLVLSAQINTYSAADSCWAWFSATGDTKPLKRLLDNYLYNPNACINCIQWSYSSNAQQNADVKNYLLKYMADKTDLEKKKLATLLPK
jgi:hypothetical protein